MKTLCTHPYEPSAPTLTNPSLIPGEINVSTMKIKAPSLIVNEKDDNDFDGNITNLDDLLPYLSNLGIIYQTPHNKLGRTENGHRSPIPHTPLKSIIRHGKNDLYIQTERSRLEEFEQSTLKHLRDSDTQKEELESKSVTGTVQQSKSDQDAYYTKLDRKSAEIANKYKIARDQATRSLAMRNREKKQQQLDLIQNTIHKARERKIALQTQREERRRIEAENRRKEEEKLKIAAEKAKKEQLEKERKQAEEKQRLLAKEQAAKEQAEKEEALRKELEKQKDSKDYGCPEAFEQVKFFDQFRQNTKQNIDIKVKTNRAMMTEALQYRIQITTKVGAVTSSKSHILQFYTFLDNILTKGKSLSPDLLYPWLLNNLSKQAVKQAENEISANMKKAIPLANLLCLLSTNHPDLINYLYARMIKKCQYIAPVYPKRETGDTDNQMRLRMGYRKADSSGKLEDETHFQDRMNGIAALYFGFLQARPSDFGVRSPHPHGMENAKIFIERLLNMKPRKITPSLIETFLKVLGNRFVEVYREKAHQIIQFIRSDFLTRVKSPGTAGPKLRLELFIDEYLRKGSISPLEGSELRS